MPRTNIYIDRTLVDFEEIEGLPIELNASIDKFLDIESRLTGTKMDGGLQQLVLPATKGNSATLGEIWQLGGNGDATRDILIEVDGQPIFAGKCKPTEVIRSWNAPSQYFLELFGGAADPLSRLENVLLTDLDMGVIATDSTTVNSSFSHNFGSAAATATFAPVAYGSPVAGVSTQPYHTINDLRPHIPYTSIFNGIFPVYLGYKVNSTFYDTEFFRRCHYMFGVGNQWKRDFDTTNYSFEYTLTSALTGSPPVGLNKITYGTLVSDPSGMWDGANYFFTAPVDGYYSFDIEYTISAASGSFTMKTATFGQGIHNLVETQVSVSGPQVVNYRKSFPNQYYAAGQTFFIASNTRNTNVEVTAQSSIKGRLDIDAFMGADIKTETCLHRLPVKDFLRGVFHQFNLTGRFELITKQFYFEPRMNYKTSASYGAGHAATYTRTERDGYYLRPLTSYVDWSDKVSPESIKIKRAHPFGDNLILGYQKASDPTTKAVLAKSGAGVEGLDAIPPVYGIRVPTSDVTTGQGDKVSLNPFFYPLPNASLNGLQPGTPLPAMLPDGYDFSGPLPDPTFEFNPTCGFYYGVSSNIAWKYQGTGRTLPMMYMQPPLGGQYFVRAQDCLTYSNTGNYINGQISDNKGLTENFYYNYIQCIKHGDLVEATVRLRPEEVFSETFTKMKYFLDNYFILTNIKNYNPLTGISTCTFQRYTYGMTAAELTAAEAGMSSVYNTLTAKP